MERFLANQWDRSRAQKRGGGHPLVPLQCETGEHRYSAEPADLRTPEQAFERHWALVLLGEVLQQVQAEYQAQDKGEVFSALRSCLVVDREQLSYDQRLQSNHIAVAAMYRPRFLGEPTVPEQVDQAGQPAFAHGRYPCFSSAAARQWIWSWGAGILTNCPQVDEIIVYNPLDNCQCDSCRLAKASDPDGPVWTFLGEARTAWRARQPTAI